MRRGVNGDGGHRSKVLSLKGLLPVEVVSFRT